jgi:hypothetical protein
MFMEVVEMTEPVICHNGKCRYAYRNPEFLDECVDCDIVKQIEHDLLSGKNN